MQQSIPPQNDTLLSLQQRREQLAQRRAKNRAITLQVLQGQMPTIDTVQTVTPVKVEQNKQTTSNVMEDVTNKRKREETTELNTSLNNAAIPASKIEPASNGSSTSSTTKTVSPATSSLFAQSLSAFTSAQPAKPAAKPATKPATKPSTSTSSAPKSSTQSTQLTRPVPTRSSPVIKRPCRFFQNSTCWNGERCPNAHIKTDTLNTTSSTHDYSQHFINTGLRPQNYIRGERSQTQRYDGVPQLQQLITTKDEWIATYATEPMTLNVDLSSYNVRDMNMQWDVIIVDPPWIEYQRRFPGIHRATWSFEQIKALPIKEIASNTCWLFLWCCNLETLEQGRQLLTHWGFRRCEDIVVAYTNKYSDAQASKRDNSILQVTTEHCLMAFNHSSTNRMRHGDLHHAHLDVDVMVADQPQLGSTVKPMQMYELIERFSNGRRRLELFGQDHNIRRGWVTVGNELSISNWNRDTYLSNFIVKNSNPPSYNYLMPFHRSIEANRPGSPTMSYVEDGPIDAKHELTRLPSAAAIKIINSNVKEIMKENDALMRKQFDRERAREKEWKVNQELKKTEEKAKEQAEKAAKERQAKLERVERERKQLEEFKRKAEEQDKKR